MSKQPSEMTDDELLEAAKGVVGLRTDKPPVQVQLKQAPRIRVLPPDTIEVRDSSDLGGLKAGQHINITGRVGKWMVTRVHDTGPGEPRKYDVGPLPNRKARKAHAARGRK